jgi:hypothetical protein
MRWPENTRPCCGMNLAIMDAVTERLEETGLVARLEPAPDRCCVVLQPAEDVIGRTRAHVAATGVRVDADSILAARDAERR